MRVPPPLKRWSSTKSGSTRSAPRPMTSIPSTWHRAFGLACRAAYGVPTCAYFHLRANEGSFDPTLGSDGEWDGPGCGIVDFGYDSCNALEAYTVDLEITRRVCLNDCWMQFSAGVRHAELQSDASLFGTALADDSQIFGFADSHRSSRGTGIVLGWYGRRPIFPCSCIHWFYNAHWSCSGARQIRQLRRASCSRSRRTIASEDGGRALVGRERLRPDPDRERIHERRDACDQRPPGLPAALPADLMGSGVGKHAGPGRVAPAR